MKFPSFPFISVHQWLKNSGFLFVICLLAVAISPRLAAQGATLQSKPTATSPAGDDWLYLQGATNGIRKLAPSYYLTSAAAASTYQPLSAQLTELAGLSGTNVIYYRNASGLFTPVTIGTGLSFTTGTLSSTAGGGNMSTSVYDTNGTGGVDLAEAVPWSGISSKPTTLSGYGITDSQPLDSDLTSYANAADAAARRALIGAGTSSFDGVFASLTSKPTTLAGYGITDSITAATAASTYLTQANAAATYAPIIATGSIGPTQLASTTVTAGSYTLASITVDADGRLTAASNGSSGAVDIDGLTAGTNTDLGITDNMVLSDGGTEKKYTLAEFLTWFQAQSLSFTSLTIGTLNFTTWGTGTVPDANIASTIARDSEVTAAVNARNVVFLLTIDAVADSMNYTIAYVPAAFTITELRFVHNGTTSSPSITPTIKHGTDRSSGTAVVTSPSAVTSMTTGASVTSFNSATTAANAWLWVETASKSGTTDKFTIAVVGHY